MTVQTRGFGAARKPADVPCIEPTLISPQITPGKPVHVEQKLAPVNPAYLKATGFKDCSRK